MDVDPNETTVENSNALSPQVKKTRRKREFAETTTTFFRTLEEKEDDDTEQLEPPKKKRLLPKKHTTVKVKPIPTGTKLYHMPVDILSKIFDAIDQSHNSVTTHENPPRIVHIINENKTAPSTQAFLALRQTGCKTLIRTCNWSFTNLHLVLNHAPKALETSPFNALRQQLDLSECTAIRSVEVHVGEKCHPISAGAILTSILNTLQHTSVTRFFLNVSSGINTQHLPSNKDVVNAFRQCAKLMIVGVEGAPIKQICVDPFLIQYARQHKFLPHLTQQLKQHEQAQAIVPIHITNLHGDSCLNYMGQNKYNLLSLSESSEHKHVIQYRLDAISNPTVLTLDAKFMIFDYAAYFDRLLHLRVEKLDYNIYCSMLPRTLQSLCVHHFSSFMVHLHQVVCDFPPNFVEMTLESMELMHLRIWDPTTIDTSTRTDIIFIPHTLKHVEIKNVFWNDKAPDSLDIKTFVNENGDVEHRLIRKDVVRFEKQLSRAFSEQFDYRLPLSDPFRPIDHAAHLQHLRIDMLHLDSHTVNIASYMPPCLKSFILNVQHVTHILLNVVGSFIPPHVESFFFLARDLKQENAWNQPPTPNTVVAQFALTQVATEALLSKCVRLKHVQIGLPHTSSNKMTISAHHSLISSLVKQPGIELVEFAFLSVTPYYTNANGEHCNMAPERKDKRKGGHVMRFVPSQHLDTDVEAGKCLPKIDFYSQDVLQFHPRAYTSGLGKCLVV
jgi:hypothetical protein